MNRMPETIAAIFAMLGLVVIFSLCFYLRMIPAINNRVEFVLDCAFNYRMTASVLERGDVPARDVLSTYPEGKDVKSLLPTAMYHLSAIFYKAVNRFKTVPPERSILYFTSFCGSLICAPLYLISREIYRNRFTACLTALVAGAIPAYLNRSLCYWYRYEAVAAPLLFMSLYFFMKAFGAQSAKRATALSAAASAVFLMASLYIWRLSVLFLLVYTIIFFYVWAKAKEFQKRWLIVVGVFLCAYVMLIWFVPGFKNPTSDYGAFPKAALEIILRNTPAHRNLSDFTRIVLYNQELIGVKITEMFGWLYLSLSGLFVIVFFASYSTRRYQVVQKDILFVFLVFYTALTFMFLRNKTILGPLAALTIGESIGMAVSNKKIAVRWTMACLIAVILAKTGYDSYHLVTTRYTNTRIDPDLKQALAVIRESTPKDAVLLCYWGNGYLIQTYANRATMTDGLLESPQIVKRIVAESKICYSYSDVDLKKYCAQYGVTHILMPNDRKMAIAGYAGVDYGQFYKGNIPTDLGRLTVLYKLMWSPEELKWLTLLYRNKRFVLYALKG